MQRIAISDIHGNAKTFEALLDKIGLNRDDELYLLGDYVDRGPDSKRVIDRILDLKQQGYGVKSLIGNHEIMMENAHFGDASDMEFWWRNGGEETMKSFQLTDGEKIPELYIDFVTDLHYYFEVDHYILVHAGLDFRNANPYMDKEAMVWIRKWYDQINYDWLGDRIIIHGHSTVTQETILQMRDQLDESQYLDIDNGCYRAGHPGMSALCAFNFDDRTLTFQNNIDQD